MSLETGFDSQVPSLPDPGSATALGETFSAELSTGTANFAIRIDAPNGPNDIGPRLALRYGSAAGNGPFGLGFDLALPRIVRSIAHGFPLYNTADTLVLEGAGELLRLPDGRLQPVVDGGAWRIQAQGDGYQLMDRAGSIHTLGESAGARLFDAVAQPDGRADATFAWHLERIEDALGNTASFSWERDGNQLYLSAVEYGAYRIAFQYGDRPDSVRWGRPGFLIATRRRCVQIELSMPGEAQPILRRWQLAYTPHETNGGSLLSGVTLTGIDAAGNALEAPPLSLTYSTGASRTLTRMQTVDQGTPPGLLQHTGRRTELIDWFGTGLPDLLEISGGGRARVWPNTGSLTWGRPQIVGSLPLFTSPDAAVAFVDMNGDGLADLVRADRPLSMYIPRTRDGFQQPVSWRRSPPNAPTDAAVRLADVDGDGVVDLLVADEENLAIYYRSDPDGWVATPQLEPASVLPAARLRDPHVFLADMTGSGSKDLVRVDGAGVTYWPSLGRGRFADQVLMENPPQLPFNFVPSRLFLQDIDGDGCVDLVYLGQGRLLYWINQTGNRYSEMRSIDFLPVESMLGARWADMSGNGVDGLLWSATLSGRVEYFFLDFVGGAKPYLLTGLDNGSGQVTSVSYSTSAHEAARDRSGGAPWQSYMPVVVPVVSAIERRDQATGVVSRTEYRYHDGRYDGVLREFAGFGRVERTEIGDQSAPPLLDVSQFLNGRMPLGGEPETMDDRMARRALRGRLAKQERSSPDGTPEAGLLFDRLEQAWTAAAEVSPAGVWYRPRLVRSVRSIFERSPGVAEHLTTNTAWDDNGNVTDSEQSAKAEGDDAAHILKTHSDFAVDPAGRFLSLAWRIRQFDSDNNIIADTITEYDHAPEGQAGAQGLVTRRSSLVLTDALVAVVYGDVLPDFASLGYFRRADQPGWWATQTAYTRVDDASGLRGTAADALGATTSYLFNANRTFPTAVTDPVGNQTTAAYDERVARPALITDPGGSKRAAAYDGLARVTSEVDEGDSTALPTLQFDYSGAQVPAERVRRQRAVTGEPGTIVTREFYDGSEQLIERRTTDDAGEIAILSRRNSSRGYVAREWRPFRPPSASYQDPGDALPHVEYFYDAVGRLVRVVNPDGSFRTTTYAPLLVTEVDEEDNNPGGTHGNTPTLKHLDATGRVVLMEQNLGGRLIATTYQYDIKGNVIEHVDENGNAVRFWFDLLGQQLRVERPERDTCVVRDARGLPVESRARGGDTVFRQFDTAQRLEAVRVKSPDAVPVHAFTYHDAGSPPPPNASAFTRGGRLVRIDDEAGTTVFDYDARGRRTLQRWKPANAEQTYALEREYRADGRVGAITYPDGGAGRRRVEYVYDQRALLVAVPTVAPAITNNVTGQVTGIQFANGTALQVAYDDDTGRVVARGHNSPAGWQISTEFAYDKVGNVTSIASPDAKLAVTYTYDDNYRLVGADTPLGEQYQYRYADNGSLTFKSDVGEYRYGEGGAAATCLTTAGPGSLAYGPLGDVISAPWGDQLFDALGRLRSIANGGQTSAEYLYDSTGRRVVSTIFDNAGAQAVRLTPDPYYSIEAGVLVLNLFAGPQIVARQSTGGVTSYLHLDHLGGLAAVSDEAGALIDSLRYDPYGRLLERSGAQPAQPMGFTGGEFDLPFGLLYLQARYYHPGLGVFISVDPIVGEQMNPIAWAAYVYCGDNPATRTDPSGLSFNLVKFVVEIVAVAALVALVVVSAGTLSGPAIALVAFGAATGGTIGAVTVAEEERKAGKDADFWDILIGATVGAAVGGWAAYATVYGSAQVGQITGQGLGQTVFGSDNVFSGALNNTITQSAAGFASEAAKPIARTGSVDLLRLLQAAISGAVSGAAQGALFGSFNTRDLTDQEQEDALAAGKYETFTGKFNPRAGNAGLRYFGALVVSGEQVASSQIDWHPNFFIGTAESSSAGTGLDVWAGFLGVTFTVLSY